MAISRQWGVSRPGLDRRSAPPRAPELPAPRRPSVPLLAGLASALLACAGAQGCGTPGRGASEPLDTAASSTSAAGPLVVALVVDQLPAWLFEERAPTLPAEGGFARLRREATAQGTLAFGHAANATAPGHAALHSGAVPRDSGVVSNEAIRSPRPDSFLADRASTLVCGAGASDRTGPSLRSLRVETVADRLRAEHADATIISLSMKDRGAIFGGGRAPSAALFWDASSARFCTATPFAPSLPSWAAALASPEAARARYAKPWEPLDPAWLEQHAGPRGAALGQGDFEGLGASFPHTVTASKRPGSAYRATPAADAHLVDLAIASLPELARDRSAPRMLSISFSANDYVGHVFGVDSWEAWDQLRRLDAELARLFAALDAAEGADGWALVLSADHGVPPTPESLARGCDARRRASLGAACAGAHRVLERDLAAKAEQVADRLRGPGDWVLGFREPYLVFSEAARALEPRAYDELVSSVSRELAREPGLARLYDVRKLGERCPGLDDESLEALVCRSVHPEESGDLYVVFSEGSFIDTGYVEGHGVNHGSPWRHDREVPILVRAPGRPRTAGAERELRVDHRAYASTLAGLLGVAAPEHARGGRDLSATSTPAIAPATTHPTTAAQPARAPQTKRSSPFPPPPLTPPVERTKKPGDGVWRTLEARGARRPHAALASTLVHPHRIKPFVVVEIVAIDPSRLELELVSGTEEPEALHVPPERKTGLVPQAQLDALVAAFNGGFKRRHGQNGMRVGADVFVPFLAEGCVVAKTEQGYELGPWRELEPKASSFLWARQTPPCLVHEGKRHPDVAGEYGQKKWGAAEDGNKEIRRSALGISPDGETLYFAIGDWVNAEALADAMLAAGVRTALELDINYSYTRFVLYEGEVGREPVASSPLLKELKFGRTEYWKTPAARDFFYLAWRGDEAR